MIADSLVVEFRVTGDDCPLAEAARETGIRIDARPPQRRRDGNVLLRFSTDVPAEATVETGGGVDPDRPAGAGGRGDDREDPTADPALYGPVATTLDADPRIRYLHASLSGDRINYRCLSKHPCVVHALTDAGFLAESLQYGPRGETYTGAVVGYDVLDGVLAAGADHSGQDVQVTVERIYPLTPETDRPVARRWSITPAQAEAMETALRMGYFAVPRDADAGAVAEELGIGKSAFLERLRRGQRGLFEQVFGGES